MAEKLKPGWKRVKFGDVVRHVKDKVYPATSGLERYIAGEHMDTDDLRLRRWGRIGDDYLGPAFHMRFKPGQVLYGSRRTYLRKVAVADFEGICANTTFVLEPKDPHTLLPEYLPFVMQTEAFHEHSKRESKGSVNPYVNFSDLARYEFALPPLEEQRRLTKVLFAKESMTKAVAAARDSVDQMIRSLCRHVYEEAFSRGCYAAVGSIAKFTSGKSMVVSKLPKAPSPEAPVPVYGGNGVAGYTTVPLPGAERPTLVVGRVGQFCGVTRMTEGPAWISDNALYPVRIDPRIDLRFLAFCLLGANLNRGKLGEYLPLITQSVVHDVEVPCPTTDEQLRWIDAYDALCGTAESVNERAAEARRLDRAYVSTHVGAG